MDSEQVENPATALIGSEETGVDSKGKSIIYHDKTWEHQLEDDSSSELGNTVSLAESENSYESDLSNPDDDGDYDDYTDDVSDIGDNNELLHEDDYVLMQSLFDSVGLSSGVDSTITWFKGPGSIVNGHPPHGASASSCPLNGGSKAASISSVMVPEDLGSDQKEGNVEHKVQNFESIKHFDVVDDFSDHRYNSLASPVEKESVKRIQEEWKILENCLPETIYVRVCEAKMGLLRAVIMGPSGTPYHDGLFVFDCFFPPKYPNVPPLVYYYSGGLRLNPNLYSCGKVCLSLLGTWHGKDTEMWVPGSSTMLQVLVSIQALVLNAKPFFNEPGYETSYVGDTGERRSRKYNERVLALSLKTMVYTLRKPPQHFEGFVASFFRNRARDIIAACQAYKEGATAGTVVVKDGVPDPNIIEQGSSEEFKATMARMIDVMATVFAKNGSTECEQLLASNNLIPV
ncbi:hypothetical protein HRI_004222300 [Hibiscus trionum]|uniref:E2 ubiquitin-conjugating enzyme n=1 Tax=Hibiscus trionum TaxID=183268 RepID=A0A9W7MQC4_HIBTR|nr:hypothetical protein HRI_004222300 [Hibiscus trionum]